MQNPACQAHGMLYRQPKDNRSTVKHVILEDNIIRSWETKLKTERLTICVNGSFLREAMKPSVLISDVILDHNDHDIFEKFYHLH